MRAIVAVVLVAAVAIIGLNLLVDLALLAFDPRISRRRRRAPGATAA